MMQMPGDYQIGFALDEGPTGQMVPFVQYMTDLHEILEEDGRQFYIKYHLVRDMREDRTFGVFNAYYAE